jgi:hypothetical protein
MIQECVIKIVEVIVEEKENAIYLLENVSVAKGINGEKIARKIVQKNAKLMGELIAVMLKNKNIIKE